MISGLSANHLVDGSYVKPVLNRVHLIQSTLHPQPTTPCLLKLSVAKSDLLIHCHQDKLERYSNTGESFELCKHMTVMTMDIILNCAFSSKKKTVRSALQCF